MLFTSTISGNSSNLESIAQDKFLHDAKISHEKGSLRRNQRDIRHANYLQQLEIRKLARQNYWTPRSLVEIARILSIAWYLTMELFRTNQLPSSMTPSLFRMCTHAQVDIQNHAHLVYDQIYRDKDCSTFILADMAEEDMNGRIGTIRRYNYGETCYETIIHTKRERNHVKGTGETRMVKPENMEPIRIGRAQLSCYNSKPKLLSCTATLNSLFPKTPEDVMTVRFHHQVFTQLRITYDDKPESYPDDAYNLMQRRLNVIDQEEQKEQQRIEDETAGCAMVLDTLVNNHIPRLDQPGKRRRMYEPMPSVNRGNQMNSVWSAKVQHIRNLMNINQDENHESLFSFPFDTIDRSMLECTAGLTIFNSHDPTSNDSDEVLTSSPVYEPIIVTTSSVQSLFPGNDVDDDVVDLTIKWYVFGIIFSICKNLSRPNCENLCCCSRQGHTVIEECILF